MVTVAFDPEGSGPDTHFKVLQAVAEALRLWREGDPEAARAVRVWGYRNVWFRFSVAEATHAVACSPADTAALNDSFAACFLSQLDASFPSPEYDGPFSHLAQMAQARQYAEFATLLGADAFAAHSCRELRAAPRARAAAREMGLHSSMTESFVRRTRSCCCARWAWTSSSPLRASCRGRRPPTSG